jgi:hypothetical protein
VIIHSDILLNTEVGVCIRGAWNPKIQFDFWFFEKCTELKSETEFLYQLPMMGKILFSKWYFYFQNTNEYFILYFEILFSKYFISLF